MLKTSLTPRSPLAPLAVGIALGLAGQAASAQPTVQVSGSTAVSAVNLSHQAAGSGSRLVTGPWTAPSLVFSGAEDLGNGLKASFRLNRAWT
ncbi:MAG: porin [Burkholderiaceae bacterium]